MKKYCAFAILFIALPAAAHPGHVDMAGFAAGVMHPLTGIDHLLGMLGIGMWSRRQQQPMAMPLAFLAMMALGAVVQVGVNVPDLLIAASVVLTGALLFAARLPPAAALAVAGAFALMHGQAHGNELPGLSSAGGYLLSSAALLFAGRWLMPAFLCRPRAVAPA
jgi:urease accessory protein